MESFIGTHSGPFHGDEVTAVAILKVCFPHFRVVRTRDPVVLDACAIVVDVGGEYDHAHGRYDHHQFEVKKDEFLVSSAGLIHRHFGHAFIRTLCDTPSNRLSAACVNHLHRALYKFVIREIDALDNGMKPCEKKHEKFPIHTNVSSIVSRLNSPDVDNDATQMAAFERACQHVLNTIVIILRDEWFKFQQAEQDAHVLEAGQEPIPGVRVISVYPINWKQTIADFEGKHPETRLKFLVYPGSGQWNVRNVHDRAKIAKDVENLVSDKTTLKFVHKSRFFAATTTQEAAIEVARLSLS